MVNRRLAIGYIRSAILGAVKAAVVIKAARRRAGLTQSQLAERAATTQSAIAAYEGGSKQPSVATLNRLVAGAGFSVAWSLAPAASIVSATVEAVADSLHGDDEHEALRLAADLWGRLARSDDGLAAAIEDDPGSTGDQRWDALIGGLVERAAHAGGIRAPMWTAAKAATVHFDHPGLRVRVASPRYLMAMKVAAARVERDADDIAVLYRLSGFESVGDALDFVGRTYPHLRLAPRVQYLLEELASAGALDAEDDLPS